MQANEITYEATLSIWWSFLWRACIGGTILGAVLGFIGGLVMGLTGHYDNAGLVGALMGWIATFPASIWALKAALNAKHKRLTVTPN
jgi:Mg/Co/Ni transporter MgtE